MAGEGGWKNALSAVLEMRRDFSQFGDLKTSEGFPRICLDHQGPDHLATGLGKISALVFSSFI